MQLKNPDADVFVPDGSSVAEALTKTTHMAVGAHQDDIEFMALHGILECFNRTDRWFTGITVTDGSDGVKSGTYAQYSDDEMRKIRIGEQRKAALVGNYACQIQLGFPSAVVRDPSKDEVVVYLKAIFEGARPDIVYLHNPADRHDTHVACCLRAIKALRQVPESIRPQKVYGCEVWQGLDWMLDEDKEILPVDGHDSVADALAGVFDSQISGGKRYDLAVRGRRHSNATFLASREPDTHRSLTLAVDLTPLIADPTLNVGDHMLAKLRRTKDDITDRIIRMSGPL